MGELLDVITLDGLCIDGVHGVLDSERAAPQPFRVDVRMWVDFSAAEDSDQVTDTVSYADAAAIAAEVVRGRPVRLIETLATRIARRIQLDPRVRGVQVTVHKPEAPIGESFRDVSVSVTRGEAAQQVVTHEVPEALRVTQQIDGRTVTITGSQAPQVLAVARSLLDLQQEVTLTGPMAEGVETGRVLADVPDVPLPAEFTRTIEMPVVAEAAGPGSSPSARRSRSARSRGSHAAPGTRSAARAERARASVTQGEHKAVVLALGGNVGDVPTTLRDVIEVLVGVPGVRVDEVSPLLRTKAVLAPGQDVQEDHWNAVVLAHMSLPPEELLELVRALEDEFGRERHERWGARTLDIDIIQYEGVRSDAPELTLPHPRAHERAFVLAPWLLADPDARLDGHGLVADLLPEAPDLTGILDAVQDWLEDPGAVIADSDAHLTSVDSAKALDVEVRSLPDSEPAGEAARGASDPSSSRRGAEPVVRVTQLPDPAQREPEPLTPEEEVVWRQVWARWSGDDEGGAPGGEGVEPVAQAGVGAAPAHVGDAPSEESIDTLPRVVESGLDGGRPTPSPDQVAPSFDEAEVPWPDLGPAAQIPWEDAGDALVPTVPVDRVDTGEQFAPPPPPPPAPMTAPAAEPPAPAPPEPVVVQAAQASSVMSVTPRLRKRSENPRLARGAQRPKWVPLDESEIALRAARNTEPEPDARPEWYSALNWDESTGTGQAQAGPRKESVEDLPAWSFPVGAVRIVDEDIHDDRVELTVVDAESVTVISTDNPSDYDSASVSSQVMDASANARVSGPARGTTVRRSVATPVLVTRASATTPVRRSVLTPEMSHDGRRGIVQEEVTGTSVHRKITVRPTVTGQIALARRGEDLP
ncbi:2-amino-4-hydroxy-6-hydroxymethyldihydropteridine diphosphokinase [Schaalia sp. 19OD2882]|uniref:2-amino-4-hydroxy-6- hydroxymethyldihydropteridine diphosphokinase n=1 Tax=Schaalia sp. 19OD2882 TaxID=2794089 RepID=UPI001C1EBCC6|nr:2-amino-4-hydroxy-6-hydroxymethyldihydropteridine diphosphokinase [Schaalia sp. 19OD2882]QWW19861.1 2-amino-4-hydroxy-6-hydroxymethyldihydropteridine diphosphokinase [Schaalia sp. 19OD2882]